MTNHSKTLSETLLDNSMISGVQINGLSLDISEKGHGLYIESHSGDRYIDLRLASEKPFWGHSHPLLMQRKFDCIPNNLAPKYPNTISLKKISELIDQSYNNDSIILISESYLLSSEEEKKVIGKKLAMKSEGNKNLILIERDLNLGESNNLSNFPNIDCCKIITSSKVPLGVILNGQIPNVSNEYENDFNNAACNFIEYILHGKNGKLISDRELIDSYKFKRIGHYLMISNKKISREKFISQGILVSDLNFPKLNQIVLCIPPSCTKKELLDTMDRLTNLITE
jgi:hypothetical protein